MQIEILAAPPVNGDTYLIRPTRNGALNLEMNLADSRQIATASPVRSETALSNTGSGVISAGVVTDIDEEAGIIELDLTLKNEKGETPVVGTARIRL